MITHVGYEEGRIPYCGENLDVEKHHLFADLKNHLDAEAVKINTSSSCRKP